MKKVSVVIPCYNQSKYLPDAVLSVINSTYKNIEIIVVNDGSTDITEENLKKLLPDNVILLNQKNSGVCTARNNGINASTGEYILPLDADDKIAPEYIEKAVKILDENPDTGIVYCEVQFFGSKNDKWDLKPATVKNMLIQNRIYPSGMFRKSTFKEVNGYNPYMNIGCGDWDFWLSIIETGVKVFQIHEILFYYRKSQNQATQIALRFINYIKIRINIIKRHKKLYLKYPQVFIPFCFLICKNLAYNIYKFLKPVKKVCSQCSKSIPYRFGHKYGITTEKRSPKLIVSLTTFKERINEVHLAINTLLHQTLKPDEVILWLAKDEFENRENDLPESLTRLIKYGLTIKWVDKDIKSYKKLLPALNEYPEDIIVCADDDIYYRKNWLKTLYNSYLQNPEAIHCHRAHKITFGDCGQILPYNDWVMGVKKQEAGSVILPTSGAGLLIPPGTLYKDINNIDLIQQLAPDADDLWIWTMINLNHTKIYLVKNHISYIISTNTLRDFGFRKGFRLCNTNCEGGNDKQLDAIIKHYPELVTIINQIRGKEE